LQGSSKRLAMQHLQIPNTAKTRNIPKWLSTHPASQTKIGYPPPPSGCCTGCSHIRENKKATD
jgi:hypothetical protein